MRHFLLPCAVRARSLGVLLATATTGLIASACFALCLASGRLCAILRAVDVAAVAAGADQYLRAAARA